MQKQDVIVLGAGIVGVATALHLQARGRSVCLIDRNQPGQGTSYGNAGLIERSSVIPYSFPRGFANLVKYGLNNRSDVRYDPLYLPKIAGWLYRFWRESAPDRLKIATEAMLPLVEACVKEHDVLVAQAGCENLIRRRGWIEVFKHEQNFTAAVARLPSLDRFNLNYEVLDRAALLQREPSLDGVYGGIHWLDPNTVTNPGGLVAAYARLFVEQGGIISHGDANNLVESSAGWQINTDQGQVSARDAVIALGPQSALICQKFGYRVPLGIKRGHHLHFRMQGNVQPQHTVVDEENGYVLAPMEQGVRLTTGIEFADPNAPANWIQINRDLKYARRLMPQLGDAVESKPWLGLRPCLPDMCPIIGAAPRHKGLWFNFGHAHHGLTIGPATGRLLAEVMTGETAFTNPHPYRIERYL